MERVACLVAGLGGRAGAVLTAEAFANLEARYAEKPSRFCSRCLVVAAAAQLLLAFVPRRTSRSGSGGSTTFRPAALASERLDMPAQVRPLQSTHHYHFRIDCACSALSSSG